ncbi:MAG: TRAP transporter substrate-binding protein [Brevibacillus sp.]|nr:TRAP transporter substrate-binding protein [Brevibacillus sp.]
MQKRVSCFSVCLLSLLLVLSGCGSSSTGGTAQTGADQTGAAQSGATQTESSGGETYTIKFAHVVRPTVAKGKAADKFAELIEQKTNGRITVEVFPDSQLGSDREILEQIQSGTLQMGSPFTGVMPSFVPQFQVFDLPFLFEDKKEAFDAMHGALGDVLNGHLQEKGFRTLGYWDGGFKHFTNSKQPIEKPADMNGLKMRTSQSPLLISQFRALGAGGISVDFAELYTALQNKTVDGQENPLSNIVSKKLYEVQDYMTLSAHGYMGYVWLISDDFYNKLPQDLQQAVDEAAKEVNQWQWEQSEADEQKYMQELKESGIQITELTPENRQAFIDATKGVYDEFKKNVPGGEDLLKAVNK